MRVPNSSTKPCRSLDEVVRYLGLQLAARRDAISFWHASLTVTALMIGACLRAYSIASETLRPRCLSRVMMSLLTDAWVSTRLMAWSFASFSDWKKRRFFLPPSSNLPWYPTGRLHLKGLAPYPKSEVRALRPSSPQVLRSSNFNYMTAGFMALRTRFL